ncbi:MAG: UbiA family prenyltransferase [Chloroflexota bacterium]
MPAVLRVIHPAPALAVVLLSAALAAILAAQHGGPIDAGLVILTVLSIAGSQVFTGATNDLADRDRDAAARPEKPIPSGDLSVNAALWVASIGLGLQLAASLRLGVLALALGAIATASALAYNLALSRTPASVIPYLISFGVLPFWIAAGVGVPAERVFAAALLVPPFAGAAHLANTARDFDADASGGSRSLAQVLGRERSRRIAFVVAMAVGIGVGIALLAGGGLTPAVMALGLAGLVAVAQGARDARRLWYGMLVAAVCWTAAWAIATG